MRKTKMANFARVPLEVFSAPSAFTASLVCVLLTMGIANSSAEEKPAGDGVCFLVPLDGQTTASTGGPMAIADITVCYRALPAEFSSPTAPVLKAQATTPGSVSTPVPAEIGADAVAIGKPDPT